jgi:hypothetical protein
MDCRDFPDARVIEPVARRSNAALAFGIFGKHVVEFIVGVSADIAGRRLRIRLRSVDDDIEWGRSPERGGIRSVVSSGVVVGP